MPSTTEFEPRVGEIRAVRTFRVGPGGVLFPLFGAEPWRDGTNSARCRVASSARAPGPHPVPHADCSCGYYAYGTEHSADEYPQSRNVVAVVACWGRIVAGTRGLRCQYARVEAIWTSDVVPAELVDAVALRYPSAQMYTSKPAMYGEHPITDLDCYVHEAVGRSTPSRRLVWTATAAVALSSVPAQYWWGSTVARLVWVAALAAFLAVAIAGGPRRGEGRARHRGRLTSCAVLLWVLAGPAGVAGWVFLRVPLLVIAGSLATWRRRELAAADRFPAVIE